MPKAKQSPVEQLATQEMKKGIDAVLGGQTKVFKASLITPQMVVDYLQPQGWQKSDLETNGWQYDWWLNFTKAGKSFTAFGSGYYGSFEFHKSDE